MSQQSLNLRRSAQIVRRHRILVGAVTLAGLLIAIAFSVLRPPLVTSTSLVVFAHNTPNVATEVVIVGSEPVLSRALPDIHPRMTLLTLQNQLTAKSLTSSAISISARGKTDDQAESAANAVAKAYIAYVSAPKSPVGPLAAQMLQPATTTTGLGTADQGVRDGGLGAAAGLLVGAVVAILVGRRERALTELDDIANSIGVPVLAAVSVGRPSDAAGWMRLIDRYTPGSVEAWWLRRALQELGIGETTVTEPAATSVTVLSMSSDPRALALGPQLAAYAASLGIPTALAVVPQTDTNATAALYTACAAPAGALKRSSHLRTAVAGTMNDTLPPSARLVVVVAVIDAKVPELPATLQTDFAVLGVTAGAGTSEQLARLASAAVAAGGDILGFLVANPDSADHTTGRIPRSSRAARRAPLGGRKQDLSLPSTQAQPTRTRSAY